MLSQLTKIISKPHIAVDLGTANTRIYDSEAGRIAEEPSVVRLVTAENGTADDDYIAYVNANIVVNPLRGGVIIDSYNAVNLLRPLVKRTKRFLFHPNSLACAPTDTTERERKLLADALIRAGASHVAIIPELFAAAVGGGADLYSRSAKMVIDVGDGVTDMAVFREGNILCTHAVRTACSDLKNAIRSSVLSEHRVKLASYETEKLTNQIKFLYSFVGENDSVESIGVDIITRNGVKVELKKMKLLTAMNPVIEKILSSIDFFVNRLPDEIYCEIIESGILLTGGGACISGFDEIIAKRINMDVLVARDPIHCVINGATMILNTVKEEKSWCEHIVWPLPSA